MVLKHSVNAVFLTSVCCVQLLSSGISAVRHIRGARAQSRESNRREKPLDMFTSFYTANEKIIVDFFFLFNLSCLDLLYKSPAPWT